MSTAIEWTDVTDNIIVVKGGGWWCRKLSDGCTNCYAAKLNQSEFFGGNKLAYSGEPRELELRTDLIDAWDRQRTPKKHFVASMTDVFGEWVPRDWIFRFLDGMAAAPRQTFQVLTKRPAIALDHIATWCAKRHVAQLPENIWIGCTVENEKASQERLMPMRMIPAKVRFVSYEPALTSVDWTGWHFLSWLISGGESGPNARPSSPDWHREARDFCGHNGIAYFFKQWGAWGRFEEFFTDHHHPDQEYPGKALCVEGDWMVNMGKKATGRCLDGLELSEFPKVA